MTMKIAKQLQILLMGVMYLLGVLSTLIIQKIISLKSFLKILIQKMSLNYVRNTTLLISLLKTKLLH